jgi:hypothetical protein
MPGKTKYNRDYSTHEYLKLLKQEAQKRIETMIEIIKSRGITDYDLDAGIELGKQNRKREHQQRQELIKQMLTQKETY